MEKFTIKRTHYSDQWTLGTIDYLNRPFAQTCELPWKENQHNISCIPPGKFIFKRGGFGAFANYFQALDVPGGRLGIFIHGGNAPSDSKGCIIIGESFGVLNGAVALLNSRTIPGEGFLEFMDITKDMQEFELEILLLHFVRLQQ